MEYLYRVSNNVSEKAKIEIDDGIVKIKKVGLPFDVIIKTLNTQIDLGNNIGVFLQIGNNYFYYSIFYQTYYNAYYSYNYQTQMSNSKAPIKFNNVNSGDKLFIKIVKPYEHYIELSKLIEEEPYTYYKHSFTINGDKYDNTSLIKIPITDTLYNIIIERINPNKAKYKYEVHYYIKGTTTPIYKDNEEYGEELKGETITRTRLNFSGYDFAEPDENITKSITISTDESKNVIIFYYKDKYNCRVRYYETGTDKQIRTETKFGGTVGARIKITNYLYDIPGYTFNYADPPEILEIKTETLTDENIVKAYYDKFYETVDLGLPSGLKWAKCNVGAEKETEYGLYFAWGETDGYKLEQIGTDKVFDSSDYKYKGQYSMDTKYNETDNKTILDKEDDAAFMIMGNSWRMPTETEFKELLENTNHEWYQINGVNGRRFSNRTDPSKYIFLPAAGGSMGTQTTHGKYWTSSLVTDIGLAFHNGWGAFFNMYGCSISETSRYQGFSIRGVHA